MKNLLSVFFLLYCFSVCAQDSEIPAEEIIYKDSIVDVQPEFPGGIDKFYSYFAAEFKKPNVPSMVDKLVLSFIVEKDGTLTDIRVIHDSGFGTANPAIAIVEKGPKWTPGSKDGKPVRVFHRLSIPIVTED